MSNWRYLIGPNLVDISEVQAPLAEPHPATFDHEAWHIRGDGATFWNGPARVTWLYENQYLSAAAWNELQSFVGSSGYGLVYIRTRTDKMTPDGKYQYEIFQAIMSRPKGRPIAGERFGEVSVDFLLIHNPAKGFDANPEVNVTLFPGTHITTTSTSTTSTSTTTTLTSTSTTVTTTSSSTSTTTMSTSTSTTTTSSSTSTSTTTITSTSTSTTSSTSTSSTTSTSTLLEEIEYLILPWGCDNPVSAAIDMTHGYLYIGTLTSPGRVVAIRLSNFTVAKTLILAVGEDFLYGMAIDVSRGYLYASTYTAPPKIVKMGIVKTSLDEFTKIDVLTLE